MSKSTIRVRRAAAKLGMDISIIEMPDSTRTSKDAARVCGCDESQIVKSLIFQRSDDQSYLLLLVAGNNRVNIKHVENIIGSRLAKANAEQVREITGFAVGGVAPIGHKSVLPVYIDPNLLGLQRVWAAAGTPNSVFSINPKILQSTTQATVL